MVNLLNKKFPIKNGTDVIGYKKIKKVFEFSNSAGFFILFNKNDNIGLFLGYKDALDISKNQNITGINFDKQKEASNG